MTTTEQLPLLSTVTLVCWTCGDRGERQVLVPSHGIIHHTEEADRQDHDCVSWYECPSCRTRYRVESKFVDDASDRRMVRYYSRGPTEDTWTLLRGNE